MINKIIHILWMRKSPPFCIRKLFWKFLSSVHRITIYKSLLQFWSNFVDAITICRNHGNKNFLKKKLCIFSCLHYLSIEKKKFQARIFTRYQNKILGVLKKKCLKICVWNFFFFENRSKKFWNSSFFKKFSYPIVLFDYKYEFRMILAFIWYALGYIFNTFNFELIRGN